MASLSAADLLAELSLNDEQAAIDRLQQVHDQAYSVVQARKAQLELAENDLRHAMDQGTYANRTSDLKSAFDLMRSDLRAAEANCRRLTDAIRQTTSQQRREDLQLEHELAQNDLRSAKESFRPFKLWRDAADKLELARTDERAVKKKKDDEIAAILKSTWKFSSCWELTSVHARCIIT